MVRSRPKWEGQWKPLQGSVSIPDELRYYTLNLLCVILLLIVFEWYFHFIQELDGSNEGTTFKYWISFLVFIYFIIMVLVYLPFPGIRKRELKNYYELIGSIACDFDEIAEVVRSAFGEMEVDVEINVKHLYGFYFSRIQFISSKDGSMDIRIYEGSKSAGSLITNPLAILFLGHSHRKHHLYSRCDSENTLNQTILKDITSSLIEESERPGTKRESKLEAHVSSQDGIDSHTLHTMIEEIRDEDLFELLEKVNGHNKAVVIRALGKKRCENAVDSLLHLLHDQDRIIRLASAITLGKIGDIKARESLLIVSQSDGDADVRKAAREAFDALR